MVRLLVHTNASLQLQSEQIPIIFPGNRVRDRVRVRVKSFELIQVCFNHFEAGRLSRNKLEFSDHVYHVPLVAGLSCKTAVLLY